MTSSFFARATRITFAASAIFTLAGCSDSANVVLGPTPVDPMFASYVAMGNSITAGYQSGGINDSTQKQSYAALLAAQMHTRYAYASLVAPGCAPPIIDFTTQGRLGGGTSTDCHLRDPSSVTDALNNVAVPGATSFDPFSSSTAASNALTTFILGGKSQIDRAADANPTFLSAWFGNNDVLAAAGAGLLVPTAGVSPGITDTTTFKHNIDSLVTRMKAIGTLKGAIMIGVVQVAAAPILFPASALNDPVTGVTFRQKLGAAAGLPLGTPIPVDLSCTGSSSLISFAIIGQIRAGTHPAIIACSPGAIPTTPVGDIFVLDATEQATLAATVTAYNTYIASVAAANGWAFWDPNPTLAEQKTNGCIASVLDPFNAAQPFGPCFTLDGVHPSALAHKIIVNGIIGAINAKYNTTLATVPTS